MRCKSTGFQQNSSLSSLDMLDIPVAMLQSGKYGVLLKKGSCKDPFHTHETSSIKLYN